MIGAVDRHRLKNRVAEISVSLMGSDLDSTIDNLEWRRNFPLFIFELVSWKDRLRALI
jgi:hypothetical protein